MKNLNLLSNYMPLSGVTISVNSKGLKGILGGVWNYSGSLGALALLISVIGASLYWGFSQDGVDLVSHFRGMRSASLRSIPEGFGKLTKGPERSLRFAYKDGKLVKVDHVNSNGVLMQRWADIPASMTLSYTDSGKLSEKCYLDEKGVLCDGPGGFARVVLSYNAHGDLIKQCTFNQAGDPVSAGALGYAEKKWSYNADHQLVRVEYVAANGTPAVDEEGINEVRYAYNAEGKKVKEEFLVQGHLANTVFGYAQIDFEYDAKGLLVQQKFLDAQQALSMSKKTEDQCATKEYVYGDKAEVLFERHFDAGSQLLEERRCEYDAQGRLVKDSYHDAQGNIKIGDGKHYAEKTLAYRPDGKISSEYYKDAALLPGSLHSTSVPCTVSERRYLYDDHGACSSMIHIHPDGSVCSEL